jgi:hypothetical protein
MWRYILVNPPKLNPKKNLKSIIKAKLNKSILLLYICKLNNLKILKYEKNCYFDFIITFFI